MMIKFRDLLNPLILNDGWVGFCGNSEYICENGEVRMGYWAFLEALEIDDPHSGNYLTLDDEIDDSKLFGETIWEVENDEGLLCTVEFTYNCANEMTYNEACNDASNMISEVEYTISNIHMRNICLEDYKSHYMHIAQDLKRKIECNTCGICHNAFKSYEKIEKLSYDLINVKEEVITRFQVLMNLIEQLDCELHDLIEEKNS